MEHKIIKRAVFLGMLVFYLNMPCYALFTAVDRREIANTQQGLLNANSKIDAMTNNISALSGNSLSLKSDIKALSDNVIGINAQLQASIEATAKISASVGLLNNTVDKSNTLNAGGNINQNDTVIYKYIIGVMGFIMLLMAILILYIMQSERLDSKEENAMLRDIVITGKKPE